MTQTKTLVVANQKGGVGKSTIAYHLARYAAEKKKLRVLLVDLDEGDLAAVFQEADENADYLYATALFNDHGSAKKPRPVDERIDLVSADGTLVSVDDLPHDLLADLSKELQRPKNAIDLERARAIMAQLGESLAADRLALGLNRFEGEYDLIVMDAPPNLQRRMISALATADAVVTPIRIGPFYRTRLEIFMNTVYYVATELNLSLRHIGYLPNLVATRSVAELQTLDYLKDELAQARQSASVDERRFMGQLFEERVMDRTSVSVALAQGVAVWQKPVDEKGNTLKLDGARRIAGKEMMAACEAILQRLIKEVV